MITDPSDIEQIKSLLSYSLSSQIRDKEKASLLNDPVKWEIIDKWSRSHGISNVFLFALKDLPTLPNTILDKWNGVRLQFMMRNLRFFKAGAYLFSILEKAQINAVAMRGLTLLHKDYAQPWIRTMGDVDILIDPKDRSRLLNCLKKENIVPRDVFRSQYVFIIKGMKFEVHWSFLTSKRYVKKMDSSGFIKDRQVLNTEDGTLFCLSDEHELIGLITHAFIHHELSIIKQLIDIVLYISKPGIDWDYISNWCKKTRMTKMFVFTISLVGTFFNIDIKHALQSFDESLAKKKKKEVHVYIDSFFTTRLTHLFTKKKIILYAAEDYLLWIQQLIRFFSMTEVNDILKRYFKQPTK